MTMYHYTCRDGYRAIKRDGWILRPHMAVVGGRVVWLTDLAEPDGPALGLASHVLVTCDRTEFRLRVEASEAVRHWPVWCRETGVLRRFRDLIEFAPGAQPLRWFVSPEPLACEVV
jgi:hypothetical protein